ncbi:MAG: alkaline phosphatase D family protein [Candidatus Corynebacterium faecigallinarum]|uniref:alkaline phosphatase D family protein n=1 Tax=Candidatus Corynebacterium faecigallinarum TaxID=2838528 RepID=UPI003FB6EBFF
MKRRRFLAGAAAGGAGVVAARFVGQASAGVATDEATGGESSGSARSDEVFAHSVASGDPRSDSVVIWTRVTPTADATPGSGAGEPTEVRWEVGTTPDFGSAVASGTLTTDADRDHTVKVDVTGLSPATTYHYRFTVVGGPAAGASSRVGRTRTAPADGDDPGRLRFGVVSCSNYEAGYFRAYRSLAERDDVEFVLHLGDYTYEYETGEYGAAYDNIVRRTAPANRTTTLTDYRIRQGHYRRDADLADLHASKPMICVWDDHEFYDNAWRDGATGDSDYPDYAAVKQAATQAYFEWMPVRAGEGFGTTDTRHLYRHLRYGTLFELIIPDLRTYRDAQVLMSESESGVPADPDYLRSVGKDERTMLGRTQFDWFADVLTTSPTTWQVIGNSVMFAPMTLPNTLDPRVHDWLVTQLGLPEDGIALNADQWDGYMAERQRIVDLITDRNNRGEGNVVFLTGDIHTSWASDIPVDAGAYRLGRDTTAAAAEFVTPSVTAASAYDSIAPAPEVKPVIDEVLTLGERIITEVDSWYKYVDLTRHGHMVVDIDHHRTQVDWLYGEVLSPDAGLSHGASYLTDAGNPGVRRAAGELDRSQTVY